MIYTLLGTIEIGDMCGGPAHCADFWQLPIHKNHTVMKLKGQTKLPPNTALCNRKGSLITQPTLVLDFPVILVTVHVDNSDGDYKRYSKALVGYLLYIVCEYVAALASSCYEGQTT